MANFPEARLDILLELKKVKEERILRPGNYHLLKKDIKKRCTHSKHTVLCILFRVLESLQIRRDSNRFL